MFRFHAAFCFSKPAQDASSSVGRSRPLGVVECHPVLDDTPGLEAVSDFFEIDRLLLQAAPQPFDKDIVQISASVVIHAALVNCDP